MLMIDGDYFNVYHHPIDNDILLYYKYFLSILLFKIIIYMYSLGYASYIY